jgi:hypothetical protein
VKPDAGFAGYLKLLLQPNDSATRRFYVKAEDGDRDPDPGAAECPEF